MSKYASGTEVNATKTLHEIDGIVSRFGGESFGYIREANAISIMFKCHGLQIRMVIAIPDKSEFALTEGRGQKRHEGVIHEHWEKECRRRMRSLALVIKAKLVAVEDNVATFEQEFMPYVVMDNGQTFGDVVAPRLLALSQNGHSPTVRGLLSKD